MPSFFLVPLLLAWLVVAACSRAPADPATPEGSVRLYLEALKEGDVSRAHARLVAKLKSECTVDALKPRTNEFRNALDNASVVVRRTRIDGDSATVEASINSGQADVGPLGPRPTGSWDQFYQLTKVGDEWLLSEYGWPMYGCPDARGDKPIPPPATTPSPATPTATPTAFPTTVPTTTAVPG